jgi:hypothetical protein
LGILTNQNDITSGYLPEVDAATEILNNKA